MLRRLALGCLVVAAAACHATERPRTTGLESMTRDGGAETQALSRAPEPARIVPGFDCTRVVATEQCAAEEKTLDALETAIACGPVASPTPRAERWDHKTAPALLDRVERRFALTTAEREHLFRDGLVVPARLEYRDYTAALHDVYRSELPLYVSVDALLHAVYASHDKLLSEVEASTLSPTLKEALQKMHDTLGTTPSRYPTDTVRDLDVYLGVARRLFGDEEAQSIAGAAAEIATLVRHARAASGLTRVDLFGRQRYVDFGAFRPRGHYAEGAATKNYGSTNLAPFFRGAMWLSRIELNLVSRSSQSSSPSVDPRETPREATLAIAIADLAEAAGVSDDIANVNGAWAALAGAREDVSIADLTRLARESGITGPADPNGPDKLRGAIGKGFVRTARTHFQAEPSPELPVIATMLGPRITPDTMATRAIVHPNVPGRAQLPAVEMAFALGQDRALDHLKADLTAFPPLRAGLDRARDVVFGRTRWDGSPPAPSPPQADLYSAWMTAIRGLAEVPAGTLPSFTETDAFRDLRVSSTVAAYGQIRHNHVLILPTTYEEGGCEIPDGYVEPAPAVYLALLEYAERGARGLRPLGHEKYFDQLARVVRVLGQIAERELANESLRDEEKRFLSMVAEEVRFHRRGYGPSTPTYSGWYYRLFSNGDIAHEDARLVADYFASVNEGTVEYAGVTGVRMGIFVVDTGGVPRAFVGPVARAFQARGPITPRFSDDEVPKMTIDEPWAASYTARPATSKPFVLTPIQTEPGAGDIVFEAKSTADVGTVSIALLDHHRVPIATVSHDVRGSASKPAKVRFEFTKPEAKGDAASFGVEGMHVSAGEMHYFDLDSDLGAEGLRWEIGGLSSRRADPPPEIHRKTEGKRARF